MISGVSMAVKAHQAVGAVIGVESSGAPGDAATACAPGSVVTLDRVDCIIDGLRVKRVGETTFEVVRQLRGRDRHASRRARSSTPCSGSWRTRKLVVEGAAAAPVAALLHGLVTAPAGREGRLRPERRQRQPRSAERPALELGSDRPDADSPTRHSSHRHLRVPARRGGALRRRPQARSFPRPTCSGRTSSGCRCARKSRSGSARRARRCGWSRSGDGAADGHDADRPSITPTG